ncbi:MAG: hypothetical protein HRT61_11760 [Ekhidna sp.]|nr:hypothetical protein [Ekhidna sp.]
MKFTCTKHPDHDGKYHIKADGVLIGHIKLEKHGQSEVWAWRTLAIAVHNNRSVARESKEEALKELKASNPALIER